MAIVLRPDSRQKTRRTLTIFAFFTGICLFALPGRAAEPASGPEIKVSQGDWPWWRGPGHDGIAEPAQTPPITWSDKQNIAWVAPVPGRGHGSPIVVGDQVVLATADKDRDVESVLCFDRTTGRQVWESVVFQGKLPKKMNEKASLASSTVACDGERFFINFLNDDAAWAIALDRQGGKLWQTRLTDYVIHQGYGSSPLLYGELVIVSADNKSESGGVIAALNRLTGEIVWKRNRPSKPNYPSPTIVHVNGRDQLIMTGCDLVTSLNPSTGEVLWEIDGATTECVTTTVTDGTHIFTSGGYPRNHISAVVADGSGKVAWDEPIRVYVPSMICSRKRLFGVMDAGIAICLKSDSGEELWKGRLAGTFSASPVLVGDLIYATNEQGETFIYRAWGEKYQEVGRNQLGDSVFATPTFCGNRIYMRAASTVDGKRQEYLYCIAE